MDFIMKHTLKTLTLTIALLVGSVSVSYAEDGNKDLETTNSVSPENKVMRCGENTYRFSKQNTITKVEVENKNGWSVWCLEKNTKNLRVIFNKADGNMGVCESYDYTRKPTLASGITLDFDNHMIYKMSYEGEYEIKKSGGMKINKCESIE